MEELILSLIRGIKNREATRDPITGESLLRYGWVMKGVALVVTAFPLVLVVGMLLTEGPNQGDNGKVAIGLCGLAFLESLLVLETFFVKVWLGEESIVGVSPWTFSKTIAWTEIEKVAYSHSMCWFVITGTDGSKIRVHELISGLGTLAIEVRKRLPSTAYANAESGFLRNGI